MLTALENSHSATELEEELQALFIEVFDDLLKAQADELNVYGMPHLGSSSLIAKNLKADQLTILQDEEYRVRHLFKAWRHQNPERGLHFLRTYLQTLWGNSWTVEQLWQKKADPYPTNLKEKSQILESDYFLTSRLRVDLDAADIVPENIIVSLKTAVAARFVLQLRIAKFAQTTIRLGTVFSQVACVIHTESGA
jgi:hypothetical protein